jgi:putative ABC transport system permease protein
MTVIINERAARTLFPDRDPIGQELLWGVYSKENPYCTVVGVVSDVRHQADENDQGMELYYPYTQWPVTNVYYVVRAAGDPTNLLQTVRQTVSSADPKTAIIFVKTMDQMIDETLWQRRLWGVMFAVFAALALLLAAIGIYSVLSYSVSQRTREIGVRMALGAQTGNVLWMVLAQGLKLALGGIVIGLVAALALSRFISTLLFGLRASDPLTYACVALLLIVVVLVACLIPARRAAKVDPMVALRIEP